ncbi:MAG: phosphoglycerate kinase [Candidatus Hodarchaeales archaeon]|jgi:phosphoglycerate kinase
MSYPYNELVDELSFENFVDDLQKSSLVFLRTDINSPLSPEGHALPNPRITRCAAVLDSFVNYGIKSIIIAHQGRPGQDDCVSLASHCALLNSLTKMDLIFSTESIGISEDLFNLEGAQGLCLENIRFWAGEKDPKGFNEFKRVFDREGAFYIQDAFAASHRKDTSMIPRFENTREILGPTFVSDYKLVSEIREKINSEKQTNLAFGGAKLDKQSDMLTLLKNNVRVFFGGIPGQQLLRAKGYSLGSKNDEFLASRKGLKDAKEIVKKFGDKIELPRDFFVQGPDGFEMVEIRKMYRLRDSMILDIGRQTTVDYTTLIEDNFVLAGPLGMVDKGFWLGTLTLIDNLMLQKHIPIIVLGGHSSHLTFRAGLEEKVSLVLAGGAALSSIAGNAIPCLEALKSDAIDLEK